MPIASENSPAHFINPVYERSFPDPFVLKFCGKYYAYCTGFWSDGNVFGVLHSNDLVNWCDIGGAMTPLDNSPPFYWAPEVKYYNGKFYLYYSVGNEALMEIRVAISDRPDGGFVDSGRRLTEQEFAIDAHPFTDESGAEYMFYATDFLDHSHIGTGTVVDKMIDPLTLSGSPMPVTRARFDWQVYDPNRAEKGGVRWHTVEGPFVLKRKNVYYQMFSGGNWQNVSYGVSFAVSESLERSEEWEQHADGNRILPILRTIPETIIGPGHNSVVRGPNNRELYCVYHRWHEGERVMALDRMDFAGGRRMFITGATHTAQPFPYHPAIFIEGSLLDSAASSEISEQTIIENAHSFLLETMVRNGERQNGLFGIALSQSSMREVRLFFDPERHGIAFSDKWDGTTKSTFVTLNESFLFSEFHQLRIERNGGSLDVFVDDVRMFSGLNSFHGPAALALFSQNCTAEFCGTAVTLGFEELFETPELDLRGWSVSDGFTAADLLDDCLLMRTNGTSPVFLEKEESFNDHELTINAALYSGDKFGVEFCLRASNRSVRVGICLEKAQGKIDIETEYGDLISLPFAGFEPERFLQFSFRRIGSTVTILLEGVEIGSFECPHGPSHPRVFVENAEAAFDMVRVTEL